MALQFRKAEKHAAKLRMALVGISGTGKTYSALRLATGMGGKVALIDTEHGRASAYAHKFDFDVLELDTFSPVKYIEAIQAAQDAGYDVLIIDSLSHAWIGKEGALEQVDKAARASRSQNTFMAWRDVTPLHNKLVEAITTSRLHVIATMRSKAKYDMEKDDKGKLVPRKIGMEPVQRDGLEYEFDLVGDLDYDHNFVISKSTLDSIHPRDVIQPLDEEVGRLILDDLTGKGTLTEAPPASVRGGTSQQKSGPTLPLRKMWALLNKGEGTNLNNFRAWMRHQFGHDSTKELSHEQVEMVIALLETQGAQAFVLPENSQEQPGLSARERLQEHIQQAQRLVNQAHKHVKDGDLLAPHIVDLEKVIAEAVPLLSAEAVSDTMLDKKAHLIADLLEGGVVGTAQGGE